MFYRQFSYLYVFQMNRYGATYYRIQCDTILFPKHNFIAFCIINFIKIIKKKQKKKTNKTGNEFMRKQVQLF